jgi:uncharacterized repeat protein (TIGR03803 family)
MSTRRRFNTVLSETFCALLIVAGLAVAAIPAFAETPTDIYNFKGGTGDVANTQPYGVITQGRDGNLYSAAPNGGANGDGGIFMVTPSGAESVIYSFASGDGPSCQPGLNLANDGNFYGNCYGYPNNGTLYKVTPTGAFTILHAFTGGADGKLPNGPPIQATDGNFYGITYLGGANNLGTVYKLTPSGTLTTLYSFKNSTDGYGPSAALVQGTDGNLYGSAQFGGANGAGTIFKISTAGKLTVLHAFTGTDGNRPISAMIQGTDGKFYGTTYQGGTNNEGVVFNMTTTGTIKVLHSFLAATDGQNPEVALLQATDGNFYGLALFGGNAGGWMGAGQGSIFKVTAKGVFSTLYLFDGTIGSNPGGALVQNTNGLLYGDTYTGTGTGQSNGIFYSWSIGAKPLLRLALTSGKVGTLVGMFGQGFDSSSVVKFGGVAATSITLTGSTYIVATVPAGAVDGYVTVTTGATTLTSTKTFTVHDSWASGAAMPTAVDASATGVLASKIYVVGGETTAPTADVQIYNPATNGWSAGTSLPTATSGPSAAVVNNVLYVFGGKTGTGFTNAVWAYNPTTKTWSGKAAMPTARNGAAAVVEKGIIYVAGGYNGTDFLATVESYNPATNTWKEEAPMLGSKDYPAAGLIGTTIVVADGSNASGSVTGDSEGYNATANTWSGLTADPTAREGSCSGAIGTLFYDAGGYVNNGGAATTVNESFSVSAHKWTTTLAPMPQGTMFPGSAVYKGLLYCFGGESTWLGASINNVQIYQP